MAEKPLKTKGFTLIELMLALGSARRNGPRTAAVDPRPSAGAPPTVVPWPASSRHKSGFTLIELMLVVAIIGVLAAIAIPKFANLVIKSKEAAVKGKLGTVRSALSLYYANNEGFMPKPAYSSNGLRLLFVPTYLDDIPTFSIPTIPSHVSGGGHISIIPINDWSVHCEYAANNAVADGKIVIDCTHTDSKGTTWSLW